MYYDKYRLSMFTSYSQDVSIKSSERSWVIVVLNVLLIAFSFANVLSGIVLDTENILAIYNAWYKHGKTSPLYDKNGINELHAFFIHFVYNQPCFSTSSSPLLSSLFSLLFLSSRV